MEKNCMPCTINLEPGTTKEMFLLRRKRNKDKLHWSIPDIQEKNQKHFHFLHSVSNR